MVCSALLLQCEKYSVHYAIQCTLDNNYFWSSLPSAVNSSPNWTPIPKHSIGLDDGLAQNRRHAIVWTNVGPIHWRIYTTIGEMS